MQQAHVIFRRHRWLAGLIIVLIEHFLTLLQGHPAGIGAKMEAFGMLPTQTSSPAS